LSGAALCASCAAARPQAVIDAAWSEAHARAELPAPTAAPPEVDFSRTDMFEECDEESFSPVLPPALYLPDLDRVEIRSICQAPLHTLLVHEFLHAIRERARRREEGDLAGYELEEESWVQDKAARSSAAPIVPSTRRR